MIRRPRWESMISTLEAMQDTLGEFTHEEVFTHLLCFKEKLRQNGELTSKIKEIALQAQKSPRVIRSNYINLYEIVRCYAVNLKKNSIN
jgi:predicted oxidoreductase